MTYPKQLKHWCKLAGLTPERGGWRGKYFPYMVGKGRRWRILPFERFSNRFYTEDVVFVIQSSDVYKDFDRWANSVYKTEPLPATEKEFILKIKDMSR